ncbi:uncharacterized protein GIQ15_06986 [Arthroderma uncinatum]|uniref:uncharacterized protein n=1 Tax=Arthroderma uncinatum TaxID=74035 RepID=UPI00144A74D7|nr:uncharacterized protein GIQ15_06986 [Arthroderma uncinatum]KAF3480010.1 hypothetical protein GIQ15_06986 [Arthroderma uncinatum]
MSGYQPTYVPGDRSPSGGQNPNSPWSTAQTIDLKTNVNRQKTKRWVNAKTYSYAGDDWGDSEDDEEEEDARGGHSNNPSTAADSKAALPAEDAKTAAGAVSQPAIIRPADIYKRLAEEKESEPSGSGTASKETAQETLPKASETEPSPADRESKGSPTQLPELRRLSGFEGFLGSNDQYETATTESRPREPTTEQIPTIKEEYVGDDANTGISRKSTSTHNDTPALASVEHPATSETADHTAGLYTEGSQRDNALTDYNKSTAFDSSHITGADYDDSKPRQPSLREPSTVSEENSELNVAALDVSPLSMSKRSSIDPSTVPSTTGETMEQPQSQGESLQEYGSQAHHQAANLPGEYDTPHGDRVDDTARQFPYGQAQGFPSPYGLNSPSDVNPSPHTTVTIPNYNSQPGAYRPPQQQLKKKFSWEVDSEESDRELDTSPLSPVSATLAPGALVINKQPTGTENEASGLATQSSQPPTLESAQNITGGETQREMGLANSPPSGAFQTLPHSPIPNTEKNDSAAPVDALHQKAPDFREITSIPQPTQRIAAFNNARGVYANTDTGLDGWIKNVADTGHPENSETIQRNGAPPADSNTPHRPVPSQAKFPKLPSLGNISLPTRHHDGSGPAHGHARQNSGAALGGMMNTQHVQAKGKDLLHSAGLLGGKAGDAAKGLFAKGRSRFRNSGSADKVDT